MIKKFLKHSYYYLTLFAILILGFLLINTTSFNRELQMIVVFLVFLSYIFWGLLHHVYNHDLNIKIVVEYVLIGTIGIAIVYFLI